jgi:hypothetical protein
MIKTTARAIAIASPIKKEYNALFCSGAIFSLLFSVK